MPTTTTLHEFHPTIPEGEVIRTDPPNLSDIAPSTNVVIYVSDGPDPGGGSGAGGFPAVSQFGGLLQGANG
jgi:hypothetical protein